MSVEFWSAKLSDGKPVQIQPPKGYVLNVRQAAITGEGHAVIKVKTVSVEGHNIEAVIATLRTETTDQVNLSLVFGYDVPVSFVAEGKADVYLSGYYQSGPEEEGEDEDEENDFDNYDSEEDSEDDEDEEDKADFKKRLLHGLVIKGAEKRGKCEALVDNSKFHVIGLVGDENRHELSARTVLIKYWSKQTFGTISPQIMRFMNGNEGIEGQFSPVSGRILVVVVSTHGIKDGSMGASSGDVTPEVLCKALKAQDTSVYERKYICFTQCFGWRTSRACEDLNKCGWTVLEGSESSTIFRVEGDGTPRHDKLENDFAIIDAREKHLATISGMEKDSPPLL